MRRLFIAGFLQAVALAQPAGPPRENLLSFHLEVGSPEYIQKIIKFENAHGEFIRDLLGCPKHAVYAEQCDIHGSTINYAAFFRASKLAPEIYPYPRSK